jgi:RES domain-containing protein
VHVDPQYPLPEYLAFSAEIPDDLLIYIFEEHDLPSDWDRPSRHEGLQDLGTKWLVERNTAVARVPATTTKGEFNYLLNPAHPDFGRITEGPAQKFEFDPRMDRS